ncbi:hypothetical protein G6O69_22685 [Pseudenhygromyxa sp. WMMC2535]|uniref:hypothetical protein n=1 Tax=Pseudenhygromyxa sp. WMMC2535 TaxID=2712867 RepID=UPI001554BF8D|nr:hypothetical protein [Pseudenhygromyxa sp. WMMC2535]NVB40663.1 hypothetical protein [Pseudenhygromyxa sp. WMMC2535]
MQLAYTIDLAIHALAGLTAVAVLPVPLIAKKGREVHRRAGWVFVVAMAIVAVTGLLLALAWGLCPLLVKPPSAAATPEELAELTRSYRRFALFFATVGVISGTSIWQGISALRIKAGGRPGALDHMAWVAMVACGAPLLVMGARAGATLFIAFGALALVNGIADARFVLRPPQGRAAWIIRHIQSMIGGATAALTAFSALTLRRYIDAEGSFSLLFWLVPVALGVLGSVAWTRSWRRRLGAKRRATQGRE